MDKRIEDLIESTKSKFGLDNYYLKRHSLFRNVNMFNDTCYTLSMEWFPKDISETVEEDLNPSGTAVIDIDVHSQKLKQAIFVMGKTYATNEISFTNHDRNDIIKWIEQETGFKYGQQFQLHKEEEGKFFFREEIDGVPFSPAGAIEVELDKEGKLIFFAIYGPFSSKQRVKKETYTLSFDEVEHMAKEQLKLIEFPSDEEEKFIPVYAVEEIYISNDGAFTVPFEITVDIPSFLKVEKALSWEYPIDEAFERQEVTVTAEVSAEQAFSCEASPAAFQITKEEEEKCVITVEKFLRQEYPDDSGEWILKSLHREEGYIHAILRAKHQDACVFQRKLMIIIDANSFQAVNYMDNKPMLEMYETFQASDKVTITKEEAFEKLKDLFELNPYYVYDFERKQYVLCGKLDCLYGVHAGSGEVISLDDL